MVKQRATYVRSSGSAPGNTTPPGPPSPGCSARQGKPLSSASPGLDIHRSIERRTGTRGGRSDPAQRWFSSFRSGIADRDGRQTRAKKLGGDGQGAQSPKTYNLPLPSLLPISRYLPCVRNASTSTTRFSRCVVKVNRYLPSNMTRREFGIRAGICLASATGAMWSGRPCVSGVLGHWTTSSPFAVRS